MAGVSNGKKITQMKTKTIVGDPNLNYLEGLKASELSMIHRLAGNDPIARKRTLRKLRKWLATIAAKIPDSPECRKLLDPNFVRVWKALFYCMWMADKPLPQEQLAEQISNLLGIFSSKPNVLLVFVDWFYLTIAREWTWIDRFRLDKFMMLIRRFLRKTLEQLRMRKWDKEMLSQFTQIISIHVFNRHPPTKKKVRGMARTPEPPKAPLGFQIHFTDIFLEELAKVGANTLKSEQILEIISPFIFELSSNDDDRLLTEIQERIFTHLIQQSDAAFDYMEGQNGDDEESEDEEEDEEEEENGKDENNSTKQNGEGDDEEEMDYDQPLDPRAGQVDVILPQLDIEYDKLAEKLVESGGQKTVKPKNKKILFALARQMNVLTEGQYPLALPEAGPRNPAISKKDIQSAAERLVSLHEDLTGDNTPKHKVKKQAISKDIQSTAEQQGALEKDITGDNTSKQTARKRSISKDSQIAAEQHVAIEKDIIGDNTLKGDNTPKQTPKKRSISEDSKNAAEQHIAIEKDLTPLGDNTPRLTPKKRGLITTKDIQRTPKQLAALQEDLTGDNTPKQTPKKRVSFVLGRNSEHPHSDYQDSIQRSPAIPYDSDKKPDFGLLKRRDQPSPSPLTTPGKRMRKSLQPSPLSTPTTGKKRQQQPTPSSTPRKRARASDFF